MMCRNPFCVQAPELAARFGCSHSAHAMTGALVRGGVTTMAQANAMTDDELLDLRGVGVTVIAILRGPDPATPPEQRRTLPVHAPALRFHDDDADDFFVVVEAVPGVGDEQLTRLHGRFYTGRAAARWAGKHLPAGHHWTVAPVNQPPRRPYGNE